MLACDKRNSNEEYREDVMRACCARSARGGAGPSRWGAISRQQNQATQPRILAINPQHFGFPN
jgi:hypothetical protein